MTNSIRIRTQTIDGITEVRAILRHPMHTGFGFNPDTKKMIPAHYIKLVQIKHNDTIILSCDWSRAVSKNPYLAFRFKGAKKGDLLELSWIDTKEEKDSLKTIID